MWGCAPFLRERAGGAAPRTPRSIFAKMKGQGAMARDAENLSLKAQASAA
jgi:hypothetical protein